jgi:dihydrofolate reductase
MKLSIVVAMAENHVIGIENRLPWSIPEDLKRFKKITNGHPIIMGRKTFESIGRVLPGRTNLIVTRNKEYRVEGAVTCGSFAEAMDWAERSPGSDEVFVIGGGEIFKEVLPKVNKIYLTIVHWPFEGDVFFEYPEEQFAEVSREKISEKPASTLHVLERKTAELGWNKI